jgi:hypothetical protein
MGWFQKIEKAHISNSKLSPKHVSIPNSGAPGKQCIHVGLKKIWENKSSFLGSTGYPSKQVKFFIIIELIKEVLSLIDHVL